MEITLEMAERLREKANVSYAQAREALEYSGGNLLDALIYLEEKGAIPRQEGAYFSTRGEVPPPPPAPPVEVPVQTREKKEKKAPRATKQKAAGAAPKAEKHAGRDLLTLLRRWLIENELEIWRHDKPITALPVLILLLLVVFAFWLTLPALVLGLFLGFRYRFSGPDLERDDLNGVMGTMADTAADLGRQVMDELRTQSRNAAKKAQQETANLEREAADLEQHIEDDLLGGSKDK